MSPAEKRVLGALAAVMVAVHLWACFSRSLWTPDEPRVAGIAREMALFGDWARPKLAGGDFYEKPPLYFWCAALCVKVFGVRDWVPRLPSLLFGLGAAVFTGLAARRAAGPRAGAVSALVLASTALWIQTTQWALVDSAAGCAAAAAMWCLVEGYLAGGSRRKALWYALFWAACSAAFLAKSVPALVAPGAAVILLVLSDSTLREVRRMHPWIGAAVFALICGPWMLAAGGDWLAEHWASHVLHRTVSSTGTGHGRGVFHYARTFPADLMPAALLLVPAAAYLFRCRREGPDDRRSAVKVFAAWLAGGILLYSIPVTKRGVYLLPVIPAASALLGLYVDSTLTGRGLGRTERGFGWAVVAVCGMLAMAPPVYAGLGGRFGPGAGVLLAGAIAAATLSTDGMWRAEAGRLWAGSFLAVAVALAGATALVLPEMEREKSLAPFARLVDRAVSSPGEGGARLIGYDPDETTRGLVAFYLGRRLEVVRSEPELEAALAGPGRKVVVTMARDPEIPHRARAVTAARGLAWVRMRGFGGTRIGVVAATFVPSQADDAYPEAGNDHR